MSRFRAEEFYDPTGERHDIPTFPWRMAPDHLYTRRQLAAAGLRPGGQQVVAQVLWPSRRYSRGVRVRAAYLYDVRLALPKRAATSAQRGALDKANRARRICPICESDAGYVLPRHLGCCLDCADPRDIAA